MLINITSNSKRRPKIKPRKKEREIKLVLDIVQELTRCSQGAPHKY